MRRLRLDPGGCDYQAVGLALDHLLDFASWKACRLVGHTTNSLIATETAMISSQGNPIKITADVRRRVVEPILANDSYGPP